MSEEYENMTLIKSWFDRVWNEGSEEAIDELYAADGVAWGLGDQFVRGPESFKMLHRLFHETLSDIKFQLEDMIAAGERVAIRGTFTMTHKASGKAITIRGGGFGHIRDGKVAEAWNSFDFLGVLIQLGAVSETALVEALAERPDP